MPPTPVKSIPDTLGSMATSVQKWFRERVDQDILYDAINDAVESLWESLVQASLTLFMGGPVQSVSFANAAERTQLVSVADPTGQIAVTDVAGGALGARTYFSAFTYVTESGTETNVCPILESAVLANNFAQFDCQQPFGVQGAMGWNCYVGTDLVNLAKQNDEPIPFGQLFQEPAEGIQPAPNLPSPPTSNTTADNIFFINHMEVLTPDGTYHSWNQAEIDSDLMRRAERSLSSSSLYQNYYWDLINQQTLELRPVAGAALNPRFFFIQKPRRMRFSNSPLPFLTVPYAAFVRYFALSLCAMTVYEYEQSEAWGAKAEAERARLLQTVTKMNTRRNNRITPYMS